LLDDKDIEEIGTGLGGYDVGDSLFLELVGVSHEICLVVTVINVLHDLHEVAHGLELAVD
jgi:hypothetical protein